MGRSEHGRPTPSYASVIADLLREAARARLSGDVERYVVAVRTLEILGPPVFPKEVAEEIEAAEEAIRKARELAARASDEFAEEQALRDGLRRAREHADRALRGIIRKLWDLRIIRRGIVWDEGSEEVDEG